MFGAPWRLGGASAQRANRTRSRREASRSERAGSCVTYPAVADTTSRDTRRRFPIVSITSGLMFAASDSVRGERSGPRLGGASDRTSGRRPGVSTEPSDSAPVDLDADPPFDATGSLSARCRRGTRPGSGRSGSGGPDVDGDRPPRSWLELDRNGTAHPRGGRSAGASPWRPRTTPTNIPDQAGRRRGEGRVRPLARRRVVIVLAGR